MISGSVTRRNVDQPRVEALHDRGDGADHVRRRHEDMRDREPGHRAQRVEPGPVADQVIELQERHADHHGRDLQGRAEQRHDEGLAREAAAHDSDRCGHTQRDARRRRDQAEGEADP
jgi:hypothetical protein